MVTLVLGLFPLKIIKISSLLIILLQVPANFEDNQQNHGLAVHGGFKIMVCQLQLGLDVFTVVFTAVKISGCLNLQE